MPRAKCKWQVVRLKLGPDGKVVSRTTIGLPSAKRRAEEIHTYQVTKEQRRTVRYVIVEVPSASAKRKN